MTEQELMTNYPSLARARASVRGLAPLAATYAATTLFPNRPYFDGLARMEEAMAMLLRRRQPDELSSQIRDIFGADDRHWDVAMTEILAFSLLERDGLLGDIRWPPGFAGDTPPFEGSLIDLQAPQQNRIPFDVKNAANVGLRLIEDAIARAVTPWATKNGFGQAEIEIDTDGVVTQQEVGRHVRALEAAARNELTKHMTWPASPLVLTIGTTTIRFTLRPYTGATVGSSIVSTAERARSIARVIRGHVISKAQQAVNQNNPFLIVYVRPPNSGTADVKPRDLQLSLPSLDADAGLLSEPGIDLWLGTILLDWTPSPAAPLRHGYLRAGARWPAGSSLLTLAADLRLTPWP